MSTLLQRGKIWTKDDAERAYRSLEQRNFLEKISWFHRFWLRVKLAFTIIKVPK